MITQLTVRILFQRGRLSMNKQLFNKLWYYFNKHINYKMGSLSGLLTGSIVFIINTPHGFMPALGSFGKQFIFNVIIAGFNVRTCEKLATNISNRSLSLIAASIIPTLQAFIVLFSIHYFGGTPKPGASTIWQAIANIVIFFFLALIYRGELNAVNSNNFRLLRIRTYFKARKIKRIQPYNKQVG